MTLSLAQGAPVGIDGFVIAGCLLFGLAAVLFLLEFVVPSAGALAVLCTLCVAGGVICFFAHAALWGFASLALALGGAPFAIGYGLRLWSGTPLARRAVLGTELHTDRDASSRPRPGSVGIARTPMRPVGRVEIVGVTHEAIADGGFVEAGQTIEVLRVEDGTLRVRPRA